MSEKLPLGDNIWRFIRFNINGQLRFSILIKQYSQKEFGSTFISFLQIQILSTIRSQ